MEGLYRTQLRCVQQGNSTKHEQIIHLITKFFVLVIFCGLLTFMLIIFVVLRLQIDLPHILHVLLFVSGSLDEFFSMFAVWSQFRTIENRIYLKMFGCCHYKIVSKWQTKLKNLQILNLEMHTHPNVSSANSAHKDETTITIST